MEQETPESTAFWKSRWQAGRTNWDLGGPHPLLDGLIAQALRLTDLDPKGRILVPGSGRAHCAAELARRGFSVVANDLVEEAVDEARRLYADLPSLSFHQGDVLSGPGDWMGGFDAIYDRAVLCALPDQARRRYVEALARYLRPGGIFMSIVFTEVHHEGDKLGPPFALTPERLLETMAPHFTFVAGEERENGATDAKIVREMPCIFRREGDRV